jgi:hypothetical protein
MRFVPATPSDRPCEAVTTDRLSPLLHYLAHVCKPSVCLSRVLRVKGDRARSRFGGRRGLAKSRDPRDVASRVSGREVASANTFGPPQIAIDSPPASIAAHPESTAPLYPRGLRSNTSKKSYFLRLSRLSYSS